jgi:hypothetical protein
MTQLGIAEVVILGLFAWLVMAFIWARRNGRL